MILGIIGAALIAGLIYLLATIFDPTPNNRYAGIAALVIFILLAAGAAGLLNR